ncbi:cytokine receptor-like factor 1 [Anneissia japonica]|uniref:cytokine receptor-like factor 1 n=1 Tax=Anneissia japonica TaxID=1529436 RepID=UPI001425AEE8|nr:cytokine receptor-like factor 1 [Anneissia japonica]
MKWSILLLLFFNTIFLSDSSNVVSRSASNLTCYGYSPSEYVCTWVPGNESIEYVARWQDEENEYGFWRDCTDARENACHFYGEITNDRKVTVQPKDEQGDSNSVETTLYMYNFIPLPPRNLTVVPGETAQQLYAEWKDSHGWTLFPNQLIFRIRYRKIDSVKWSITTDIDDHEHLIDGLDAFTKYVVQVQAKFFANDVYGIWSSPVFMTTREGAPSGSVSVLPLKEYRSESKDYKTYRDVLISWMDLPKHHHRGILLGYKIKLVGEIESSDDPEHFQVPANKTTFLIHGLKKRLNYTAYITAYNAMSATEPSAILIPVSDDNLESVIVRPLS